MQFLNELLHTLMKQMHSSDILSPYESPNQTHCFLPAAVPPNP